MDEQAMERRTSMVGAEAGELDALKAMHIVANTSLPEEEEDTTDPEIEAALPVRKRSGGNRSSPRSNPKTPEPCPTHDTAGLIDNSADAGTDDDDDDDDIRAVVAANNAVSRPATRAEARIAVSPDPSDMPLGPTDEEYRDFRPLNTIFAASLSCIASFLMICAVFIVPGICGADRGHALGYGPKEDGPEDPNKPPTIDPMPSPSTTEEICPVRPFSLLIYCHAAYWLLHLFIDPYLKTAHKKNRMQGYLLFYMDTKNMRRAPFYAVSVGNFALLVADVVLNDFCHAHPASCDLHGRFTRVDWLRGLITVEAMAILCLFGFYIRKIQIFNRGKFKPDVMRPEIMHGLGVSLVLKFPRPEEESTEEEETHRAGLNLARDELRRLEMLSEMTHVFGNDWKEEDTQVRMMQAELIAFLIRQIKRKNRKVVTLTHHLARFTDDVQGLVAQGIEF